MSAIRIVLVDDHPVVRQGLRALLEAEPDFELAGEAGDGLEAVRLVERLKPEVLIADLMLPSLGGLEVARQISQLSPQTAILILSMHADDAYVLEALKNGARGYVLKDSSAVELVQAVRCVIAGQHYLSAALSERVIDLYTQQAEPATTDVYDSLTTREREVLQLAAEGHSNTEIAERLFISARTVENHRAHVMRKLGLNRLSDLIYYAVRKGIIRVDR